MKRGFFGFGKDKYARPQISPVPEGQKEKMSGTMINESARQIRVEIFDCGTPEDLLKALGHLEIAKDIVKQTLSVWHEKDRRVKGIITPPGNGHA